MKENFACQGPFVQNTVCFMILLLCQGFVQSTRTHKMKCAIIFYEKKNDRIFTVNYFWQKNDSVFAYSMLEILTSH